MSSLGDLTPLREIAGGADRRSRSSERPALQGGTFPFSGERAGAGDGKPSGSGKIVSAKDDDEVLGVHVIGPMAGAADQRSGARHGIFASTEDIQRTIHAHPTLSRHP